jgi:hypothetical protein
MTSIADRVKVQGTQYDHRRKLTLAQRKEIKKLGAGYGIRALAREYGVSHRTIQFILYPERLLIARSNRDWKKYHDRAKLTVAVRKLRARKTLLIKEGKLTLKEKKWKNQNS